MIDITDVTYLYPGKEQPALDNVNLSIDSGELFGLLGPNGAGKTTLISLLTGLRVPSHGTIQYDKKSMSENPEDAQRKIGWVPQEYAFYPTMSVVENLRFFAGAQNIPQAEQSLRIEDAAQVTGLTHVLHERVSTFSGGLKRRLNVAISLLGRPDYLFLDEPTVGIDPQSRHFILEAIREINAGGTTVIYSSHYMDEVESLCRYIAIVDHGKILTSGPIQSLLGRHDASSVTVTLDEPLKNDFHLPASTELSDSLTTLTARSMDTAELGQLLQELARKRVGVKRVVSGSRSLEHLFLELTDRTL